MIRANLPLAICSGEPAGIGPDICLGLSRDGAGFQRPLVVIGNHRTFAERAVMLGVSFDWPMYEEGTTAPISFLDVDMPTPVLAGMLDCHNASGVLAILDTAIAGCQQGRFAGMVTAPVHKGIINDSGVPFSGHTEYLAQKTGTPRVVMMLAGADLRVALATTHLPLKDVSEALTQPLLEEVLTILHNDLKTKFGIASPRILVTGLNPHAGESGHLGREEIEVIEPVLLRLRRTGMQLQGPLPADTLFQPKYLQSADAVLAMYHDQGLPVLKFASFGEGVNITLGLPFIRTSVDHGTALDLAGTGKASDGSLLAAIEYAELMAASGH
ncbi:4-hydroxythreonine-4-phosphate dehydrogenase PdxA [Leeia oryzae]|uniref:4-hydroxythreonine-4-phosphate dehydrogenase PdxA n=1 Tax=Leeia oryzae TaxID=356662 RepID=UPI000372146E|nr:4-hydroxythreonine-4-phosphate dehydrogenase PdxA [Leeia oryzae]